ncbi:MAG TPA: hypothetical protein QGH10_18325, partial [Armatimonadota bacterium]|nr:hypothetical protein [Armatimonadota bacterium]
LGELCASVVAGLEDAARIRPCAEHLSDVLQERHQLNGYLPHVVSATTNRATDDPMDVDPGHAGASFSHCFAANGLIQHGLVFGSSDALRLGRELLAGIETSLESDRFLAGATPAPKGHQAQGPYMITLGVLADCIETLDALHGPDSDEFASAARDFLRIGPHLIETVLTYHSRPSDGAFWEVRCPTGPVRNADGRVVVDPGHAIEFTGFAARFARYLTEPDASRVRNSVRTILEWVARAGVHPTEHLLYKNVDRDTGEAIADVHVQNPRGFVSEPVFESHFGGRDAPVQIATLPWWAPWELLAAAACLRGGAEDRLDPTIALTVRAIFKHYPNDVIEGLCLQTTGDGFLSYVDIPPAMPALDLMHVHRPARVFIREMRGAGAVS